MNPNELPPIPFIRGIIQAGIVVRDLDKALEHYVQKLGVGPWAVYTYAPPELTGTKVRGVEVPYSMKLAITQRYDVMWELIQPLEGPSIYKEFLRDHGEGIHHLMVDCGDTPVPDIFEAFEARGWPCLMEGTRAGGSFAYFATEGELTTTIEIRWSPPGWQRPEPDYWYPAAP